MAIKITDSKTIKCDRSSIMSTSFPQTNYYYQDTLIRGAIVIIYYFMTWAGSKKSPLT